MEPSDRLWWRNPTPNDAHEAGACPASTVAAVEPTLSHHSQFGLLVRFTISPAKATSMERMIADSMTAGGTVWSLARKLLLMPSLEVLETMDKSKIGVLVGASLGGLTAFSSGVKALIQSGHKKISPFLVPYTIPNMGSALLAIDTGLMGPSYCISTACATKNHCFFAAAGHIRRGEANIMVAGATEAVVTPVGVGGFIACRALSQRKANPTKLQGHGIKNVMALSLEKALVC